MEACYRAGIRIPDDVSVTGIDGIFWDLHHVGLSTVRLPIDQVAARAAQVMGERLEEPRRPITHETIAGALRPGASLAAPHHPPR
ncbi:Periplasmic binding protein-like domain [Corynebacterium uterequi]|uniref:Periplasmic binding protein-like domain n=1 Tax=Corynebacterium uterequi TaxID=1072256 RepID=A0A0G3HHR7_9CORY|nr:Periplasmic binding protein-like domain [Corynebacterium uterequi]